MRESCPQQIAIALEQENGDFILTATETFDTQNTLFFIPVAPLYQMMQDKRRKQAAKLLLCTFAYLYQVAGVPSYTEEDSYLCYHYEMLREWVTDDPGSWETEDYYAYCNEINAALHMGQAMKRRLGSPIPLDCFGTWLSGFAPSDFFSRECHCLAQKFYALWQEYPKAHIYRHADTDCLPDPEDYDDTDCITMEKYIGFIATTKGWLYNQLEQTVNNDFNECTAMQEPVLKRCFDGQKQDSDSLDFECRLFPLINELCYLLNNCDYDT